MAIRIKIELSEAELTLLEKRIQGVSGDTFSEQQEFSKILFKFSAARQLVRSYY